jgi:hypothetical protein
VRGWEERERHTQKERERVEREKEREFHSQLCPADIVSCIMAALEGGEVKRSRKQIVNQLVRQELVEDRKSLQKKPAPKKTVSHVTAMYSLTHSGSPDLV